MRRRVLVVVAALLALFVVAGVALPVYYVAQSRSERSDFHDQCRESGGVPIESNRAASVVCVDREAVLSTYP